MNRAYSIFTTKALDEETRTITGIATTPTPDRAGDIVEPKGATFKLPIPLLWHHNSQAPIGQVTAARVGKDGIEVTATLAKTDVAGTLKDRLDEAWQSLKIGLVRGLSIGFHPLEHAQIEDSYGYHFLKWEWVELSAVTVPANAEASIQTIKRYDDDRAAFGRRSGVIVTLDRDKGRVRSKSKVFYLRG